MANQLSSFTPAKLADLKTVLGKHAGDLISDEELKTLRKAAKEYDQVQDAILVLSHSERAERRRRFIESVADDPLAVDPNNLPQELSDVFCQSVKSALANGLNRLCRQYHQLLADIVIRALPLAREVERQIERSEQDNARRIGITMVPSETLLTLRHLIKDLPVRSAHLVEFKDPASPRAVLAGIINDL